MTTSGSASADAAGEPVGTVAEEAVKLVRALAGQGREASAATATEHDCPAAWCPVCQVVGFVKGHPDAVDQVTTSAAALVRTVRDVVEAALMPQEKT